MFVLSMLDYKTIWFPDKHNSNSCPVLYDLKSIEIDNIQSMVFYSAKFWHTFDNLHFRIFRFSFFLLHFLHNLMWITSVNSSCLGAHISRQRRNIALYSLPRLEVVYRATCEDLSYNLFAACGWPWNETSMKAAALHLGERSTCI